jgi:hypothetical protein
MHELQLNFEPSKLCTRRFVFAHIKLHSQLWRGGFLVPHDKFPQPVHLLFSSKLDECGRHLFLDLTHHRPGEARKAKTPA